MSFNETGGDLAAHTGEHVHDGELDFDVWAYNRPGSGHTIVLRRMPPQQMLDELGVAVIEPAWTTINIAQSLTTYLPFAEVEDTAERIPWDTLTDDIQGAVFAAAASGWVWNDVEHFYDPESERWWAAS